MSQDVYTSRAGAQVIQPRFTSHGFQYIEITGIDRALPLDAVEGVAISSVRSLTADYRTSSAKVNRLWSNLVWSNIDNFLSIPTDCPQRNERMGWSGDINVFSRTATYVSNADQFLTRHMHAMRDVQAPNGRFTDIAPIGGGFGGVLWGSAGIVVPWETYQQYGDTTLLEQHYPAMKAYVDYLESTINPETGLSSDCGPRATGSGRRTTSSARRSSPPPTTPTTSHRRGGRGPAGQGRRREAISGVVREASRVLQRDVPRCRAAYARDWPRRLRRAGAGRSAAVPPRRHADVLRGRSRHGAVRRRCVAGAAASAGGGGDARERGRRQAAPASRIRS